MATVIYSNQDENRFWLRMMGDGALLIHNAITPNEIQDAKKARELADRFDALVQRADNDLEGEQLARLNHEAYQTVQDLRQFTLQIINAVLTQKYKINIKLSVINGLVTMADEYTYLLTEFMKKKQPLFDSIGMEIVWLPILTAQARHIVDNVGTYKITYRNSVERFEILFGEYLLYAIELQGFSRIGKDDFLLVREHQNVLFSTLKEYYEFLSTFTKLVQEGREIGTMSLLFLESSLRGLCYIMTKMSVLLDRQKPDCDPYAQRISSF